MTEFAELVSPLFQGSTRSVRWWLWPGCAALVLTPAEHFAPAHPQPLLWRKGLYLDAIYWFSTPLADPVHHGRGSGPLLLAGVLCLGVERIPRDALVRGFGPLSRQPVWLQCVEILLLSDFVDYWTHRLFHRGPLWRVHAIHHSPQEMNWISSSRVQPLNDLVTRACQLLPILVLGFSASAILSVVPLVSFYVMFLHSNVRWDFGPLRWVLVSPAYHRWHHAADEEGIDKNFAGIFPVWDLLFGHGVFPATSPQDLWAGRRADPETLLGQLAFPLGETTKAGERAGPEP